MNRIYFVGLACLFMFLLIPWEVLGRDYLEIELPGIRGIGVYYNEMFRGKVNPAAVWYVRESLSFDIAKEPDNSDFALLFVGYDTRRISISNVYSKQTQVKMNFEDKEMKNIYGSDQNVSDLFVTMFSFNIALSRSVRIGIGQRISYMRGIHFRRRGDLNQPLGSFGDFDMDLTSFALDAGLMVRLSEVMYLSLYGLNLAYFNLGDPLFERVGSEGVIPEMEIRAPIIVGGGPTIAFERLVALNVNVSYSPHVGDPPLLQAAVFYAPPLIKGLKLGVGGRTAADSDWLSRFEGECVVSFWIGRQLAIRYSLGISRGKEDEKTRLYHRGGISWLWKSSWMGI